MIYAMSDIHGCLGLLERQMEHVNLDAEDRIIFLGDYMDYGPCSGQVLRYLYELQQRYGSSRVVALKGNHEAMFLEWIRDFDRAVTASMEDIANDSWLKFDAGQGYNVFPTLVGQEQFEKLKEIEGKTSLARVNAEAVQMVLEANGDLVRWMRSLPLYYETQTQIFVHAGVDEEAEDLWKWGTEEDTFLWKYPASLGKFCKTIIAGHIGTGSIAQDRSFHDIYYDGASHYYIDGSAYDQGKLLLLGYDERKEKYYQIEDGRRSAIRKKAKRTKWI